MEELKEILTKVKPGVVLEPGDGLIERGVFDSFDIINIVDAVCEHYRFEIDPRDILVENFDSLDAILALVNRNKIG